MISHLHSFQIRPAQPILTGNECLYVDTNQHSHGCILTLSALFSEFGADASSRQVLLYRLSTIGKHPGSNTQTKNLSTYLSGFNFSEFNSTYLRLNEIGVLWFLQSTVRNRIEVVFNFATHRKPLRKASSTTLPVNGVKVIHTILIRSNSQYTERKSTS